MKTVCPLDCPDLCSLEVRIEDDRVQSITGDERNPLTGGLICGKVRRFADHMYGSARLESPLIREGAKGEGSFRRASWEQALSRIADELSSAKKRHGGASILPLYYGGSNGHLTQDATDARLFRRLGSSRLLRTVCAAPTTAAANGLYGKMTGVALEDYQYAKLIVVWGANPHATGIHVVPIIERAQKNGAKLVVLDPRRTKLAKRADLHLDLRPGCDLPVALCLIRTLFSTGGADADFLRDHCTGAKELQLRAEPWTVERTARIAGVDEHKIEEFAVLYSQLSPAVIRCGWGPERNRNGGSAIAAILALPAVAGKFGVRGGGYTMSNAGAWDYDANAAARAEPSTARTINMNRVGRALIELNDPPIKALFVYNCNPLMTLPDQERVRRGLARDDLFTVVYDQVMTDTARYADVVLPATTFLEHHELRRGYGSMRLALAGPVVSPVGDARPNYRVFADLCQRLNLDRADDPTTPHELTNSIVDSSPDSARLQSELAESGFATPRQGSTPIQFVDVFPKTADNKVHLVPDDLDKEAPEGLYAYRALQADKSHPLTLISPATTRTVSSTFGQLVKGTVSVQLHPDDAAARGIRKGDRVRIHNALGEIITTADLASDLRPGVAMLPKGLWSRSTENGATANAVVPDSLSDIAGGACFNDARVDIVRL